MSTDTSKAEKSILIVDDEEDVRSILTALATQSGYSVAEARDGQEALNILADRKFDLMILDLMMPYLTGEEVLEQLRCQDRLKEIPVIILTVKGQRREVEQGYKKDAAFYVVKPFNNSTIRELVKYLLEDLTEEEKEQILFNLMNSPISM